MKNLYDLFPESAKPDMAELNMLQSVVSGMDDDTLRSFAGIYRTQRRDPQMVLILSVVGFLVLPGLQRFYLDQIGMGILYLFTLGLCFVGSIVDIVRYNEASLEYNAKVAANVRVLLSAKP